MKDKIKTATWLVKQRANPDLHQWHSFISSQNLSVRVKEVGSNGDVLINWSDSDGWIKPKDWLFNYQQNCIKRFREEEARLEEILPQEKLSSLRSTGQPSGLASTEFEKEFLRCLNEMFDRAQQGENPVSRLLVKRMVDAFSHSYTKHYGPNAWTELVSMYQRNTKS